MIQKEIQKNKELLFSITKKDFKITYFSGTGPGGQKRNKTQNCVRLHHPDSGVLVTGQSHKERVSNMKEAFKNLIRHPKFKIWHSAKVEKYLSGKTIETLVEEQMKPNNLKIEYKKEGKWELL